MNKKLTIVLVSLFLLISFILIGYFFKKQLFPEKSGIFSIKQEQENDLKEYLPDFSSDLVQSGTKEEYLPEISQDTGQEISKEEFMP